MFATLKSPSTALLLVILLSPVFPWSPFSNPFSKDGVFTKVIEAMPGGGFITAPFHAAAGNAKHALQAAVAGFGTLSALVVGGPPGYAAVALSIGMAGIASIIEENEKEINGRGKREVIEFSPAFNDSTLMRGKRHAGASHMTEATPAQVAGAILSKIGVHGVSQMFSHLSPEKREEAVRAMRSRHFARAGQLLLQAVEEETARATIRLSAEAGGKRQLRSVHGTYLRAVESETRVDMVHGQARAWEQWYIEDWKGKVVLKARGSTKTPGHFLHAHRDGRVDLVKDHPQFNNFTLWKPFKNRDGSWSFLSVYGTFLSAREDRSVSTVKNSDKWEQFWLEFWY